MAEPDSDPFGVRLGSADQPAVPSLGDDGIHHAFLASQRVSVGPGGQTDALPGTGNGDQVGRPGNPTGAARLAVAHRKRDGCRRATARSVDKSRALTDLLAPT